MVRFWYMKRCWIKVGIVVILFIGLLVWNKNRFSEAKMMAMIETPSKLRSLTTDFCAYRTGIDPKEPDRRYVKINFFCGENQALNTISWITIKNTTVGGLVDMVAKINGVDYKNTGFVCNIDGAKADFNSKISVGNLITCKTN